MCLANKVVFFLVHKRRGKFGFHKAAAAASRATSPMVLPTLYDVLLTVGGANDAGSI